MQISQILLLAVGAYFFTVSCSHSDKTSESTQQNKIVRTGAEILISDHLDELEGKRMGLVMNPTARIGTTHVLDTLLALDANITALFAPEHGFRGEAGAGEKIEDGTDQASGLPVFSLYGDTRKPTPEMMNAVDILIFDMQDVGARFYTYISTLGLVLEAASESGTPVWILDRPNPLGGNYVSGWVLEEQFKSFVGAYPIPIAHGLTMGELARMIAGEGWMNFENKPELRVIEMNGWSRNMIWPDTGLPWVPPSPNLARFDQAFMYPGMVYFEGTTLSEGRGTEDPFLIAGDPSTELTDTDWDELENISDRIRIEPHNFIARSIPGVAPSPKHQDKESKGVKIEINSYEFDPVRVGLKIFKIIVNATPGTDYRPHLYRLAGSNEIDRVLNDEMDPMTAEFGLEDYTNRRNAYLLYD